MTVSTMEVESAMADLPHANPDGASGTPPAPRPRLAQARIKPRASAMTLSAWFDEFASAARDTLASHLATPIELSVARLDAMRFGDFLASLDSPTCLGILRVDPPNAQACVDFNSAILFPMIDCLLGGGSDSTGVIPTRSLTQIEQGFALQLIERIAQALATTLEQSEAISVREEELISDPGTARVMPDEEQVSVARIACNFGPASGSISLCLPGPVLDLLELRDRLPFISSQSDEVRRQDSQNLQCNILDAAVELRALLAQTKVRLNDVLDMRVGDVVTTETSEKSEIPIQVEGRTLFQGEPGQAGGKRAVQISRRPTEASDGGAVRP